MSLSSMLRFARRSALALALASMAGLAGAAPVSNYHVVIDTGGFSGAGFLDFAFIPGSSGASAAHASLSHFSGAFGAPVSSEGEVHGAVANDIYYFGNSTGYNDLFHSVTLGGKFSFDIAFGGDFLTGAGHTGSTFGVGLLNKTGYLGNPDGNVVQFELMPAFLGNPAGVTATGYAAVGMVAAVPEPSSWLMLGAGLAVVGFGVRRRSALAVRV
ncbi:MAG: NF038129 family PEP-CTERM protein [Pseudomonadota bacterium]